MWKDSSVRPVLHQHRFTFLSFQIKFNSSQETQQSLLQEKLREHLAEKKQLNKERLEQEEKLKAKIRQLTEEKVVRWSLSFALLLKIDEMVFYMGN